MSSSARGMYEDDSWLPPWLFALLFACLLIAGGYWFFYHQPSLPVVRDDLPPATLSDQIPQPSPQTDQMPESAAQESPIPANMPAAVVASPETMPVIEIPQAPVDVIPPEASPEIEVEAQQPDLQRPLLAEQQLPAASDELVQESETPPSTVTIEETEPTPETRAGQPEAVVESEETATTQPTLEEPQPIQPAVEVAKPQHTPSTPTQVVDPEPAKVPPSQKVKPETPASTAQNSKKQAAKTENSPVIKEKPVSRTSAQKTAPRPADPNEANLMRELWMSDQLTQVDRHYRKADFASAIRALKKIILRYPDSKDAKNAQQMINEIKETAGELVQ